MKIQFSKYQGTGNDFIILEDKYDLSSDNVIFLCDRKFGIGADGLMILKPSDEFDFEMVYYNSDGNISSFCGNGARSIVKFASDKKLIDKNSVQFQFGKELYSGEISNDTISINMQEVERIEEFNGDYILDTGSPHYIHYVDDVRAFDLIPFAREIRYSDKFPQGINVNVIQKIADGKILMRTYERGVEDETLSCGTGVTAAALVHGHLTQKNDIAVQTMGGNLNVNFKKIGEKFADIYLNGPAEFVFSGEIEI